MLTAVAGCTRESKEGIEKGMVRRATVSEIVDASAVIAPKASINLISPDWGMVAELRVKDGDYVTEGQALMRIYSPTAYRQLWLAREAAEEAKEQEENDAPAPMPEFGFSRTQEEIDKTVFRSLHKMREVADEIEDPEEREELYKRIERAERTYIAARMDYMANEQSLNQTIRSFTNINTTISSLTRPQRSQIRTQIVNAIAAVRALCIRAPIDGVITLTGPSSTATTGVGRLLGGTAPSAPVPVVAAGGAAGLGGGNPSAVINTGASPLFVGAPVLLNTPLATVNDVSNLSVVADVDETAVVRLKPGLEADVRVDAVPDVTYKATVKSVDPSAGTAGAGGVTYRVQLTFKPGSLPKQGVMPRPRPGMSAVADIKARTATNTIAVPSSAIVREGDRTFVWLVVDGKARRREVKLGIQAEDLVQVLQGVKEGDTVVVRGTDRVREGKDLS